MGKRDIKLSDYSFVRRYLHQNLNSSFAFIILSELIVRVISWVELKDYIDNLFSEHFKLDMYDSHKSESPQFVHKHLKTLTARTEIHVIRVKKHNHIVRYHNSS